MVFSFYDPVFAQLVIVRNISETRLAEPPECCRTVRFGGRPDMKALQEMRRKGV